MLLVSMWLQRRFLRAPLMVPTPNCIGTTTFPIVFHVHTKINMNIAKKGVDCVLCSSTIQLAVWSRASFDDRGEFSLSDVTNKLVFLILRPTSIALKFVNSTWCFVQTQTRFLKDTTNDKRILMCRQQKFLKKCLGLGSVKTATFLVQYCVF